MKRNDVLKLLDALDREGDWVFRSETLAELLSLRGTHLAVVLGRLETAGILKRITRGVYVNPRARSLPADPRRGLIATLRPREVSYVSLESVLSDHSVISQVAFTLTCMTTGAPGSFQTPYGAIEFIRTRVPALFGQDIHLTADGIPEATISRAYDDLVRVGRNLNLVDLEELDEAIRDETASSQVSETPNEHTGPRSQF